MSLMSSRRLRWAAPVLAAAAVAGAATLSSGSASADEHPTLPGTTAGALLARLQGVQVPGLSGTVVQTSRLGLPELPGSSTGDATLSLQAFATGSRTLRVWTAGEDHQRIALLGQLAESDVVRSGSDLWTYTSSTHTATHTVLPQHADAAAGEAPAGALTPEQAAAQALAAVDPTTAVTVDTTARVADRPAYQLVLTPRDRRSLVGSVRIALDSATSLPLRVQVLPRGSATPALEVGYTALDLSTPADSVFRFTPPEGSTLEQRSLPAPPAAGAAPEAVTPSQAGVRALGSGWTTVVAVPGAGDAAASGGALLDRLTTRVAGGRLLTSSLLSVLLADDGTVYAGAVSGDDLQKVAATGKGL